MEKGKWCERQCTASPAPYPIGSEEKQTKPGKNKINASNKKKRRRLFDLAKDGRGFVFAIVCVFLSLSLSLSILQETSMKCECLFAFRQTMRLLFFVCVRFLRSFLFANEQNLICESYCYYFSFVFVLQFTFAFSFIHNFRIIIAWFFALFFVHLRFSRSLKQQQQQNIQQF